jgi:hypothetical protein
MEKIKRAFYERDALTIAKELLGYHKDNPNNKVVGKVTPKGNKGYYEDRNRLCQSSTFFTGNKVGPMVKLCYVILNRSSQVL